MNVIAPDPPRPLAGGARIVPERTRYDWEEQWLNGNRGAVRVIPDETRPVNGAGADRPRTTQQIEPALRNTPEPRAPSGEAHGDSDRTASDAGVQPQADVRAALALYRQGAVSGIAPPIAAGVPAPLSNAGPPLDRPAAVGRERSARPAKGEPRHFGLWLDGDSVTLSLRADGAAVEPALNPLRRWLRGLGLTLRAVIVNGADHWRQPDSDRAGRTRPDPVSLSNPKTRQEITPWP